MITETCQFPQNRFEGKVKCICHHTANTHLILSFQSIPRGQTVGERTWDCISSWGAFCVTSPWYCFIYSHLFEWTLGPGAHLFKGVSKVVAVSKRATNKKKQSIFTQCFKGTLKFGRYLYDLVLSDMSSIKHDEPPFFVRMISYSHKKFRLFLLLITPGSICPLKS